jgi:hypothetical protein
MPSQQSSPSQQYEVACEAYDRISWWAEDLPKVQQQASNTCNTRGLLLWMAPLVITAGFGAAKHLSEQGYDVTLLEAAKNPGGLSGGFRTKTGELSFTAFQMSLSA